MKNKDVARILKEQKAEFNDTFIDFAGVNDAYNYALKYLEMPPCVLCEDCVNFTGKDRYCKLLQINWIPEDFGCVKGEMK